MTDAAANENPELTRKELKDLRVLAQFTSVYCKVHHDGEKKPLEPTFPAFQAIRLERYPVCSACRDFLDYAFERRRRCPLSEKPACKHCHVHCYKPGHREQVRQIMRFSGQHLIKRGRLDLLWHYWF